MEIIVFAKHLSELDVLVRSSKLLAHDPADLVQQARVFAVVTDSFGQETDASFHPMVPLSVVVEFNGDVVGQVVRLELPHRDEIRLQLDDLVQRRGKIVPVLLHLVFVGLLPQRNHRHGAQPHCRQLHGLAGRINVAKIGLPQIVLGTQLGQDTARGASCRWLAQQKQGKQQQCNRRDVDDLAAE